MAVSEAIGSDAAAIYQAARHNQEAEADQSPTPLMAESQTAESGDYESHCHRPQSREEADLCQQWRVAEATEKLVALTGQQLTATYIEISALIASLIFTGLAALAAVVAARAAQKSAESVPNIERAYVFFWDVERKDLKFTALSGQVTLPTEGQLVIYKNVGRTPAIISKTRLGCEVFSQPPIPQTAPEKEMPSGAIVGAGDGWPRGNVSVTKDKIDRAKAENASIYLYGEITYRDIFKNEQRTWFCRRWTGNQFILGDLTDPKLNGYT